MTLISKTKYLLQSGNKWLKDRSEKTMIEIKTRLGIPVRLKTDARTVLENTILPFYASQDNASKLLFVGCDYYTKHYSRVFKKFEYWTIDPDPEKKRYGGKNHIVDSIEYLGTYFSLEYFDIIICNGVFGHGLNDKESAEKAFNICFDCLRPGGSFMLGWNDIPEFLPFPLDELQSLRRFSPYQFPPLGTWNYLATVPYKHIFSFLIKPDSSESVDETNTFTFNDMKN